MELKKIVLSAMASEPSKRPKSADIIAMLSKLPPPVSPEKISHSVNGDIVIGNKIIYPAPASPTPAETPTEPTTEPEPTDNSPFIRENTTLDGYGGLFPQISGVVINGYKNRESIPEILEIPSEINGEPVICIGNDAFNNTNIKELIIHDSVYQINLEPVHIGIHARLFVKFCR